MRRTSDPMRSSRFLLSRLRGLWTNDDGAAAVIMAFTFPVLVMGMTLGAETGYWYLMQRKLQRAADVAAHAAGVRKRANDTVAGMQSAALNVASNSGFLPSRGTITVNNPPQGGSLAGRSNALEVILLESHPRMLTSIFSDDPVPIRSRAVSLVDGGAPACVLALSGTASGALTISGSTSVSLSGCSVASNSTASDAFLMSGSGAALRTDCVHSSGGAVTTSNLTLTACDVARVNSPPALDPYASIAQPMVAGTCRNRNVGTPTGSTTERPDYDHPSGFRWRCYDGGLDLKGTVTFEPGLYIINGGTFSINGGDINSATSANIRGQGVTFFLTGGATLRLTGNMTTDLSAPTSGPFSGILFFGDRRDIGVSHTISGSISSVLQGAIYTPAAHLAFSGNSSTTNGCTQIIADRVTLTGNSNMQQNCSMAGTKDVRANQLVRIVE